MNQTEHLLTNFSKFDLKQHEILNFKYFFLTHMDYIRTYQQKYLLLSLLEG